MSAEARAVGRFMQALKARTPHQPEFHQAVHEVAASVMPLYLTRADWQQAKVLERLTEPDRIVSFRVCWANDAGEVQVNRAWRVQWSNALGPYKGGLRFHPATNLSVLKFLGFEQVLKNSLTGLPMGGAKGGADFDPKGRSDGEVLRFCQSLMTELHRYIGEDVDVPAGDIGVGAREISYLFGHYTRLMNRWSGVLTGKGWTFGGSAERKEATGYGCVYFLEHMLEHHGDGLEGKRVVVSGSGQVALYAAERAMERGAQVLTLSDSTGYVLFREGLDRERFAFVQSLKETQRGRIAAVAERFPDAAYHAAERPWAVPCDVVIPCATQNELDADDARTLVANGVGAVCEGANMPVTAGATAVLRDAGVLHAPGKASNAGGVAVSGLEITQNAMRLSWSRDEVDGRLHGIMRDIHARCVAHAERDGQVNYIDGANLAGFEKVADTLLAYGIV